MKIKDISIKAQLFGSLALLLLMVFITGAVAYYYGKNIRLQSDLLYDHPFQVRNAAGKLNFDIVSIQRDMRDLLLTANDIEFNQDLMQIQQNLEDAKNQIYIIRDQYLGPESDIDSLNNSFTRWNNLRLEVINQIQSGNKEIAAKSIRNYGELGFHARALLGWIETIDDFARRKSFELNENAATIKNQLDNKLLILVSSFLFLTILIFLFLMRNIRKPLDNLILATQEFHEGDLKARSSYRLSNEFGLLTSSYNTLADSMQQSIELNKKIETLERLMISEDDANRFCHIILDKLGQFTGSQIAAIYLLSDDKKTFEHFESIGLIGPAKESFSATGYEGEFGKALSSRTIQHIKNVAGDTRFSFVTVSGQYIPCEIITIPVIAGEEVIAIVSLASVSNYSEQSIQLVESILNSFNGRLEGVLAYQKIKEISIQLELQNNELEIRKTELMVQSSLLTEQNTELELQKKQLSEVSRLKTSFLSNMSHELRTPLNSVIALASVLSRRMAGKMPEEEYSYLEVIERNGKNLLALINDILDISRIEAGRQELEITRFNVNESISGIISMVRPQAAQKNISIDFKPFDQKLIISSDVDKFNHILQNIISNAVKFTDSGAVTITSSKNEKNISVTVSDTGIGISEENIHHIFDEFRQADSSTSRRFGGTGLGLALAKKYTTLLGGNISVKSELQKGSVFVLSLPLDLIPEINLSKTSAPASYTVMLNNPEANYQTVNTNKTILLVEDSEPAIIQINELLTEKGITVLIAHNGEEALEIITHTVPDAVILDLMMPGINGFQVLQSIRDTEKTAHLPVLILTAKIVTKEELSFLKQNNIHQLIQKGQINSDELINKVLSMVTPKGFDGYVPKPIDEKFLFKVIKKTLYGE